MRKNRTMRLAALLLVLTLITSCFVGGTFAKYVTSGSAEDGARVAKFGVTVAAVDDDASAFASEYKKHDQSYVKGDNTVIASNTDLLVAPGTSSDDLDATLIFKVTGTPEVATRVNVAFEGTDVYYGDYHPVKFTLHVLDNNAAIADPANADWTNAKKITGTLAEIDAAIATNMETFDTEPNETLDALYKITWAWDFYKDEATDVLDTKLGDLAAGLDVADGKDYSTELSYSVAVSVTQID